ncbi:MAG: DUF5752 family protein [Candidatus Woesearchaeota archaeon]
MVKELENVPAENAFLLFNGPKINNLYELAESLENMKETSFRHHVTGQKNDFSNWVRDIIGDKELAAKLLTTNNRTRMANMVRDRISQLEALESTSHIKALLRYGIIDFLVGIVIGVVVGVILSSLL